MFCRIEARRAPWLAAVLTILLTSSARAQDPFEDAIGLYRQKKFKEAIAAFEKVPEAHPRFADSRRFIGFNIYVRELGQAKKGMPYLKEAFAAAPWDGDVLIDYARGKLATGKPLIKRKRSRKLERDFQFIVQPFPPRTTAGTESWQETRTRDDLEQDLDVLEFLLEEGYSYLKWREVDYQNALDGIRSSLIGQNSRATFALQVARFLTIFGDGHTQVVTRKNRFLPPDRSPFLTALDRKRVMLIEGDRTRFVDPDLPYVRSIDGEPIAKWLEAAGRLVPDGSDQFRAREAVRNLRFIGYLRAELRLPRRPRIDYVVESEDGEKSRTLSAPVSELRAAYGTWPRTESRKLAGNVGYLRVAEMSPEPRFLAGLDEAMAGFKETRGLIIDVRGNGGGSRHALRTLLPYFLEPDGGLHIASVAARRATPRKNGDPEGYLQKRFMYPATSRTWTAEEAEQVRKFVARFKPEWKLPKRDFGAWHVLGISPATNPTAYHYDKPVVILMNEGCFSATDIFLGAFQGLPKVTLLGTASGGGSGYTETYRLPNSHVEFKASRMASFRPDGTLYDGKGIQPDVFVRPIPTDLFVEGTDTQLDAAVKRVTQ